MTERKLIGIKCAEDKILPAMKFMDCLEYRLLSDLPFQLPGTIRFTAENRMRIVWYHGENPHIRPDTHLTLKGRGVADDNALTPCGRSSLYDLLCDFVGKTDLYYFYSTGSGAGCEWKESVFEKSLNGINIPAGITLIDNGAFYECTQLADIAIPPETYASQTKHVQSITAISQVCRGAWQNSMISCSTAGAALSKPLSRSAKRRLQENNAIRFIIGTL